MQLLSKEDFALMDTAWDILTNEYTIPEDKPIVISAVRCASGKIYIGDNLNCMYGALAESYALSSAICSGERKFTSLITLKYHENPKVIKPYGEVLKMLCDNLPDTDLIIATQEGLKKLKPNELMYLSL